ncbi:hemerythrin domain-containing protein [Rhodococcus sp. NPDC003382]|uniref:hemerythrin domain-containing protein n=1 Tax=unclassified Rhodococcus (in: high G+C Gram-positive bacteria) TaxID=192944 RepID=UPI0018CCB926|nr:MULTISPECIES: hemerythrin domain-containing protein [unclassified Rhodococcus (in: high G+C Gram-positive bacteria)]MBH0121896.1 hemerythrin domain-containing protein [Rhodococcus sp. CX]MCK8670317.1 hemerythrin domain-containing protein [Rhodococcus sp. HM1]
MISDPAGPADTRIMGIVHSALRRDLLRTRTVLEAGPVPDNRRGPLADHILWMMDFLRHHHEGEDTALYPLVVRLNPDAAALVHSMDDDHRRIEPAITELESAASLFTYPDSDSQARLSAALTALTDVLLPHLEREELDMMPVVSETLTDAQWRTWDEDANIAPKSMVTLGKEGIWLIDGLGADDRDHVVHLVSAIPRFFLLHVLGIANRRHFAAIWSGTDAAAVPSQPITRTPGRLP